MQPDPTIFVVDDHERVRKSVRALLESANLKVEDYASARGFLESGRPERCDCVIADLRMTEMTRLDVQQGI